MASLGVESFALGIQSRALYPVAAMRLARVVRRWRADVVQTHLVDGSLVGLSAARLARVPVAVMTAHHSHELPFHGAKLVIPERLCAGPLCDWIIAPSRQVADVIVEYAQVTSEKIEVVHHGFDLNWLDPTTTTGAEVRGELGLEGKVVFGAVGRLYEIKNFEALIRAFAAASKGRVDVALVIVGSGDPSHLRRVARELGAAERVVISGPRTDVPELFASFDVFVHPALAESFGMVIVEAMAMATPVLSTPVGIAPEVLSSPGAGILVEDASPEALAEGLTQMLNRRSEWPAMGAEARRRATQFTAAHMVRRYLELYERWLSCA
jgi:glycosyltransferase involved in cell wall biosynthesis